MLRIRAGGGQETSGTACSILDVPCFTVELTLFFYSFLIVLVNAPTDALSKQRAVLP